MEIVIKTDLRAFTAGMKDLAKRQIPFATATALTAVAGHAGLAWQDEMRHKLDRPTPFTLGAVAVKPARKANLTATVYLKDVAAAYLEPFVDGGTHFLGAKKGLLTPKDVPLNAYGNLSKGRLAALKAKGNVFIGPVKLKDGSTINGVWQRSAPAKVGKRRRGQPAMVANDKQSGSLKLLIRFSDPQTVKQRLDFKGRTLAAVQANFEAEFTKAFALALATAR